MAIITRWRMPPDRWCGKSSNRAAAEGMRTSSSISIARALRLLRRELRCGRGSPSTICWPIVWTGLSEVIGSWKIIDILPPRSVRRSSGERPSRSRPSNRTASPSTVPGGLGDQPHDRERGHALAAAGFADQPDGLAAADGEVDAVDRAEQAAVGAEVGPQAADLEKRLHQNE